MKNKALLLAAGLGTRLRPITNTLPKCLVEIGNKPILEIWLDKLNQAGCQEVLINTHYLANKIKKFLQFKKYKNMRIHTTYEPKLLGTAGTLIQNANFFSKENNNLLIHADNFTNADLKKFHEFHMNFTIPSENLITMMTFRSNNPEKCGIVEIDKNGQVKKFYEKDSNFHGNIANAAIYFFKYDLIEILLKNKTKFTDFSLDVIPLLIGKIKTYHINEELIDIGTKENLDLARKIYKSL